MKVQPAVQAETKKMALGVGVLTVLMIAVFLVIRQFDYTVLLGAALGFAAAVGNFFLMALTVQKVTGDMPVLPKREEEAEETADEEKEQPLSDEAKQAGKQMQLSFLLRMLMLGGVAALAVTAPIFHPWASLLPMLFPRIVIALRSLTENKQKEA
ncbi:MAG: hypothetical protein IJQ62_02405 [Clostridia bacterium]|nr:hypothetical protein [Clostridia bacterium]